MPIGLFSSCASPAASVPRAASFSDWRAARSRPQRSVMSSMSSTTPPGRPFSRTRLPLTFQATCCPRSVSCSSASSLNSSISPRSSRRSGSATASRLRFGFTSKRVRPVRSASGTPHQRAIVGFQAVIRPSRSSPMSPSRRLSTTFRMYRSRFHAAVVSVATRLRSRSSTPATSPALTAAPRSTTMRIETFATSTGSIVDQTRAAYAIAETRATATPRRIP
jgi:hypothetical protein